MQVQHRSTSYIPKQCACFLVLPVFRPYLFLGPTIALSMGESGVMTRILAPKYGALLTFAALRDAKASAPGQLSLAAMRQLFRVQEIEVDWKVYGVIGNPVKHSRSPLLFNTAFRETGKQRWGGCVGCWMQMRVTAKHYVCAYCALSSILSWFQGEVFN